MTATERLGNLVVCLVSFHVRDIRLFLSNVFDKYNGGIGHGQRGSSILGCADALTGLLSYEKWLKSEIPCGEVTRAEKNHS